MVSTKYFTTGLSSLHKSLSFTLSEILDIDLIAGVGLSRVVVVIFLFAFAKP